MKIKLIPVLLMCIMACFITCSCDGSSSSGGSTGGSTERDYYDTKDARNTDRHYDDGEYKEAVKNAREVWVAQTK